jgi:transposase-like protein
MAKRARKTYTTQKRSEILAAAQRENLTANDVKKKFGVTPVTYYSWRKKEGLVGRRGRRPSLLTQVGGGGNVAVQLRAGVQAKVRAMMPGIVREEVTNYLNALFASNRRPGRPRKLL